MERFRKLGMTERAHLNGVWGLSVVNEFGADNVAQFVTGGADGKLKTWRIRSEKEMVGEDTMEKSNPDETLDSCVLLNTFAGHALPVVGVAVSRNGDTAVSTSLDGSVRIWNLSSEDADKKSIQNLNVSETWGIAISADGERAITGGANGVVQVIDTNLSVVEQTCSISQNQSDAKETAKRENAMVMSVALNADNTHVAVGAHDGSVTIIDVETGKVVGAKFSKHGGPVRSIAYLPAEPRTLVTASDDQLVNLYDVDSGHVTGSCRGHTGMVLSARGSDDGKYIVSGGSDRGVRVWDRMMKESVYTFKGHQDSVWGVSYALGGSRIVSVADDGCIGVLDSSNADVVQ